MNDVYCRVGEMSLQEKWKIILFDIFHPPTLSPQKKQNNMHESNQGYTVYNPTKHSHGDPKRCCKLHWKNTETYSICLGYLPIPISQGPNVAEPTKIGSQKQRISACKDAMLADQASSLCRSWRPQSLERDLWVTEEINLMTGQPKPPSLRYPPLRNSRGPLWSGLIYHWFPLRP